MGTLSFRIGNDLSQRLAREAQVAEQTRSKLARDAIAAFLDQRERQRFLEEIARAASADRSDALALAEEALRTDNEALDRAECEMRRPTAPNRAKRKRY
jgi:predicted DNA-binding protein